MSEELVPSNRTLFAIADDLSAYTETLVMLEAQLAETPEEDRDELRAQIAEVNEVLDRIARELVHKTDAVAAVLRRLKIEREAIHQERTRLKAKEEAHERGEQWLRNYVVSIMLGQGMRHMKTPMNTLFLRATEAVEITDPTVIDPQFLNAEVRLPYALWQAVMMVLQRSAAPRIADEAGRARVKTEPSLTAIKKAIKAGEQVDGADLRLNQNLVIR